MSSCSSITIADRDFADALDERFADACDVGAGGKTRDFIVAGSRVRLRFASQELEQALTPALEHLGAPVDGVADLGIHLWDSTSTGVHAPKPPWSNDAFVARGEIRCPELARLRAAFDIEYGILNVFDPVAQQGYYWVRDLHKLPVWENAAPLRAMFGWWAVEIGGQLMHGAAVGLKGEGMLITARGGSGKSTTALACLDAGFDYCGDDYVLAIGGEEPSIYSLYSTAKADLSALSQMLPTLAHNASANDPSNGKTTLFLKQTHADQLINRLKLRVIGLPFVTGVETTSYRRAPASSALAAMAPTTLFQLPGSGREDFTALSNLARQAPAYQLELGTELQGVTNCIREVIELERSK